MYKQGNFSAEYFSIMPKKKETPPPQTFVPAPLADSRWINTPFAYARLARELTLLQQNVLFMVSDKLQDFMTKFYANKRHDLSDNPLSLFSEEDLKALPPIEIKLADFGIDPAHYDTVSKAAEAVGALKVKAFGTDKDGTLGYYMFPVFDALFVPKHDEDAGEDKKYIRRVGVITGSINPKVAAYAFNMRYGYVNHPLRIAADAGQVYTPRLYFMLKHYLGKRKKSVSIPYAKIREELGMKPIDQNTGEPIGEELYPQFSRFKLYVLDPAKRDMEEMARRNVIDITFEYEVVYKRNVSRGDPDAINFFVNVTPLGKNHKGETEKEKVTPSEPRRRGRPSKHQPDPSIEPSLFDEQPAIIPGDRVGDWQALVAEYGESISSPLLHKAEYLGTIDGAFYVQMPDYGAMTDLSAAVVNDARLADILARYVPNLRKRISITFRKR